MAFGAAYTIAGLVLGLAVAPLALSAGVLCLYGVLTLGSLEIMRRLRHRPFTPESV